MKHRYIGWMLALAGLALGAGPAAAQTLIDFTPGFGLVNPGPFTYQGVTFTNLGGGTGGPGFRADMNWGSFFSNIGGSSQGNALNDLFGNTVFQMDLPGPSSNVSILLSTTPITTFRITAFDSLLNNLGFVDVTMPATSSAVQASLGFNNVARIVVSEPNGDNGNFTLFDDLRFTVSAVPEPSTWALMLVPIAAAAYGIYHQRRRKQEEIHTRSAFAR